MLSITLHFSITSLILPHYSTNCINIATVQATVITTNTKLA